MSTIQGAQRSLTQAQLAVLREEIDAALGRGQQELASWLEVRFCVSVATLGRAALGLPVKEASARWIEAALDR